MSDLEGSSFHDNMGRRMMTSEQEELINWGRRKAKRARVYQGEDKLLKLGEDKEHQFWRSGHVANAPLSNLVLWNFARRLSSYPTHVDLSIKIGVDAPVEGSLYIAKERDVISEIDCIIGIK
ncbi:hypothetical protein Tco_1201267 [Tanacetum coccineum]